MTSAVSPGGRPTSVDVILPCLDEAEALPWVLGRMPDTMSALVVDNGSVDGSPALAEGLGARVVTAIQRGYGAACHAGLLASSADVVVVMDCDGSVDPRQLPTLVDPIVQGTADLTIGARRPVSAQAFPWQLRYANRTLVRRIRRRTGVRLVDLGPIRAANRESLLSLGIQDRRSGYPAETVVRAADNHWRIQQVDIDYLPRRGRSKVTGTPLGVWHAVRDMSAAIAR